MMQKYFYPVGLVLSLAGLLPCHLQNKLGKEMHRPMRDSVLLQVAAAQIMTEAAAAIYTLEQLPPHTNVWIQNLEILVTHRYALKR